MYITSRYRVCCYFETRFLYEYPYVGVSNAPPWLGNKSII